MFVAKKALPRRTFLRAIGATVALPMLDAMVPALSAAPKPTPRFGFVYIANGVIQKQWIPATTGPGFELTPSLLPFAHVRDQISILSGLSHLQADTFGDGTGDHPRASAVWLTGVHAYDRTLPGVEVRLATTADQMIANAVGRTSRLPSLELAVDFPTQGACDSGDCFYINTVSWRNATTPNPTESHPRVVFERLFGGTGTLEQRMERMRTRRSILDSVSESAERLRQGLGSSDRTRMSEYLEDLREIERRIERSAHNAATDLAVPAAPIGVPDAFDEHVALIFDLMAVAYQADLTRVFTFMMARDLHNRTYPQIGVDEPHHGLSHHQNKADKIARFAKINTYHVGLFAKFLARLKATPDGDGSVLDHSVILYGSGMGNANVHSHVALPYLVAGTGAGAIRGGRHIRAQNHEPSGNLLLSVIDKFGITQDRVGLSTGRVDL